MSYYKNLRAVIANQDLFDPLQLFASGEQGVWYDPSDLSTMFQDAAGTTPVASDGDPVGLIQDKSGNANHASQTEVSRKPTYRTDGNKHWMEFDGVDDRLDFSLDLQNQRWSAVEICVPQARNFILTHKTEQGNPWVGIGQDGSTNTTLASNCTQNGFYVDGVLSSATTRGGQYTDAQSGNVIETDFNALNGVTWVTVSFGSYADAFFTVGNVYGWILREGGLGDLREDVVNYGKGLI